MKPRSRIIWDELVKNTVEETLKSMLGAEADKDCCQYFGYRNGGGGRALMQPRLEADKSA